MCVKQRTWVWVQVCWEIGRKQQCLYKRLEGRYSCWNVVKQDFWMNTVCCRQNYDMSAAHFKTVRFILLICNLSIYQQSKLIDWHFSRVALLLTVEYYLYGRFMKGWRRSIGTLARPHSHPLSLSRREGEKFTLFKFVLQNKHLMELAQCCFLSWECQMKGWSYDFKLELPWSNSNAIISKLFTFLS